MLLCLFIYRGRERERNMDLLPPVCALTGNQTHNLSVYRAVLQPTGHTCQSMFINERETERETETERDRERQRETERESERRPLPGQAFIAFLGTLHQGWFSFTMHRFTTGDYLLRTTKDRILLIN